MQLFSRHFGDYSLLICRLQALELDDVVRRCRARNREVLTIARPGEVKNDAVVGEVRKLMRRAAVDRLRPNVESPHVEICDRLGTGHPPRLTADIRRFAWCGMTCGAQAGRSQTIGTGWPVDAKRRRFDVLVCWRLDRLGGNLRHLILLLDEVQAAGVEFITLGEGIDTTSPTGRLVLHVLGAISEFERCYIAERVKAGLLRARAQGNARATALRHPGREVRSRREPLIAARGRGARRQPLGRAPLAAVT